MGLLSLLATGPGTTVEPALDTRRQVAAHTGNHRNVQAGSPTVDSTWFLPVVVRVPATSIKVEFHCPLLSTGYRIKAALEVHGTITPLTFAGQTSLTDVAQQAHLTSDAVDLRIDPGDAARIRFAVVTRGAGTNIPWTYSNAAPDASVWQGDVVAGGTLTADDRLSILPIAITGLTYQSSKSVALMGDSITMGAGGFTDVSFQVAAADLAGMPYASVAEWGQSMSEVVTSGVLNSVWAAQIPSTGLDGFTHGVTAYGTNDLGALATEANAKARYREWWTALATAYPEMKLAQTTVIPRTDSTDDWATLVNQTPVASTPLHLTINAWLRDGAPTADNIRAGEPGHPLAAVIDTAATLEDPTDPTRWRVDAGDICADGTHPSTGGHIRMTTPVYNWLATP